MPPIPLGVLETGEYPEVLGPKASWARSIVRAKVPLSEPTSARDCNRPVPPQSTAPKDHLGVANLEGPELDDLTQTGWCVLFGTNTSPEIRKQLQPLIDHRRAEAGNDALCPVLEGSPQDAVEWLRAFKLADGQVQQGSRVPYYVLIVASPEDIPYRFQYELDVYWAVGRLWLGKDEDYGAYVSAVIAYEKAAQVDAAKRMTFFAPRFPADNGATALLCDKLVDPLLKLDMGKKFGFAVDLITGDDATQTRLKSLYSEGPGRPSVYFVGSHGLVRSLISPHLPDTMGAVLCAPWDGKSAPDKTDYVAGRDIPPGADLTGTIHFLFACYSGGWPRNSDYDGAELASAAMVAHLPQQILASGGLAVLAHVDRAWSYSYLSGDGIDRTAEFQSILVRFLKGARAGHATDAFNGRWKMLGDSIGQQIRDQTIESSAVAHDLWVEHDDARNYVLFGDPAVFLRTKIMPSVVQSSGLPDPVAVASATPDSAPSPAQ